MARPRKVAPARIVMYLGAPDGVERPAIISRVNSDGTVSLTVFDPVASGGSFAVRGVPDTEWKWPSVP